MLPHEFIVFLDEISACFIAKEFEPWHARLLYPFRLETPQGPNILIDKRDAKINFDHYLTACHAMRLTKIFRLPQDIRPNGDGTWSGRYETHLMRHGQRMDAPYTSTAILRKTDGIWKMNAILNARGHYTWTKAAPKGQRDIALT